MTHSPARVEVRVDGRPIMVARECTVAAALMNAGITALRLSLGGEPRGVLCAMGVCQECRMTINGVPHRRACAIEVEAGMIIERGGADARSTER